MADWLARWLAMTEMSFVGFGTVMIVVGGNVPHTPFADLVRCLFFVWAVPLKIIPLGIFQCVGTVFEIRCRIPKQKWLVIRKHVFESPLIVTLEDDSAVLPGVFVWIPPSRP